MRTLQITWRGVSPLILHSCATVNPLHPLAKEMKKYTSKRKKTDEDYTTISDIEWEAGLYWKDGVGPYVPAENIEATLRAGARSRKLGKDFEKYVSVLNLYNPIDYGEELTLDQLRADYQYRDCRVMNVQRAKILRTRPRFDTWSVTFNLAYDENMIDLETIAQVMDYCGQYIGLCDSRPKYGKFAAVISELD